MELLRFQVKPSEGRYGEFLSKESALDILRDLLRAHRPGGFEIHRDHEPVSTDPPLNAADAVDMLERQFRDTELGPVWRISEADAEWDVHVRAVRIDTSVINTGGNRTVDVARAVAFALEFANGDKGTAVCKNVGSTSTPSQHNPWREFPERDLSAGGNAIDLVHGSHQRMTDGAKFFADEHERYHVHTVIHWLVGKPHPSIWTLERGWHEYDVPAGGSDHRDHYHVDFDPQRGPSVQGAFDVPNCP